MGGVEVMLASTFTNALVHFLHKDVRRRKS